MNDGRARAFLASLLFCLIPMTALASSPFPLPRGVHAEDVPPRDLPGWLQDDQAAAFAIFAEGCMADPPLREGVTPPPILEAACTRARALAAAGPVDCEAGRRFFEDNFRFLRIRPAQGETGFMTGYFEPEFEGSLTRSDAFPTPLYDRPKDLVTRHPGETWPGLAPELSAARRTERGLEAFPDRAAIDDGALEGQGLEILWLRDPVDRFVLQVQGSGRIRLPDGSVTRLVYSGRNGLPYTSLGRVLSQREAIPPEQMTMDRLVARLKADAGFARELIRLNRSFVFFTRRDDLPAGAGPIGGAGLPLTPLRSIAIDRSIWPYGLPVWIDAKIPDGQGREAPFARLTIAQDTGSAILGPARLDLFVGSGAAAGHRAGLIRHPTSFIVLWPR
ncbi:MltA domain-containing protein [Bosea sp. (in: a-proteobacteria)]|uniref:murein transglycosylase A n=1 Tax=Bosea sp. (in: a-proteobacteria) TaxID=1871050 RepID=UPI00121FA6A4|nr:MltA domain-containing protein [Bosea sp. (in: a-proteobacteria)]TAJ34401.1 MAG: lytic murein transglycosylase [Bosea sp. (in: a-proteobacteria)]